MAAHRIALLSSLAAGLVALATADRLAAAQITYKQNNPDPFTAQNYVGTDDLWLFTNQLGGWNENTGGDLRVVAGAATANWERHELIRFNISSLAGQYSSIDAVTLRFFWESTPTGSDTIQVYPVSAANADWVEGTQSTGQTAVAGVSDWLQKKVGVANWAGSVGASTPGVDYVSTLVASATYTGSETTGSSFDLVFTDPTLIESWLSGPNGGLFLRTIGETNQAIFRSSEYPGSLYAPELIVNITPVPEPSSFALLAVAGIGCLWWRRRK